MRRAELPFEIERLPRQRRLLGRVVELSALVLMFTIVFGGVALADSEAIPFWLSFPLFAALLLFAAVAAQRMSRHGAKLQQPDALTVLARDRRPPVLFLRSFRDDDVVDLTSRTFRGMRRSEETLCAALRELGPVIGIGRPGEHLPEVGAGRLYVSDMDWQAAVRFFMRRAAAVVIHVGRSPGVEWEIATALEEVDLVRILFFFPYAEEARTRRSLLHGITPRARVLSTSVYEAMAREREERYRSFRQRFGPQVAPELPARLGNAQFLDVLDGGRPRLLETVRPAAIDTLLQVSLTNLRVGIHMERTLRPFLDKLRG